MPRLPAPMHDPAALRAARAVLRGTYHAIEALPQDDPTVRELVTQLDELCCGLTAEIEANEPELPFARAA